MANPIDKNYGLLYADVKPLEKHSEEWNVIQTYLVNTMASSEDVKKIKLLEIFKGTRFAAYDGLAWLVVLFLTVSPA